MKLRDIGEQVGFNVFWDSVNGCVQVESGKPYTSLLYTSDVVAIALITGIAAAAQRRSSHGEQQPQPVKINAAL